VLLSTRTRLMAFTTFIVLTLALALALALHRALQILPQAMLNLAHTVTHLEVH